MKKLIYICGPYNDTTNAIVIANVERAARVSSDYKRDGWDIFCPHTMMHLIDQKYNTDGAIKDGDYFDNVARFLEYCDAIHLLPGWKKSRGALKEYRRALGLGLEILGAVE